MTPPNDPPSNPYDPNWPKPEQPYPSTGSEPPTQPYGQQPAPYAPYGEQQPYGQPSQAPYGQPSQVPYGQPSQVPYGQAPYGAPTYGSPTYGGPALPGHPSATTAMVLGICALGGMFLCGIPIVLSPLAWFLGGRAVKEIDANPGRYSGRDQAQAGRIMGIIGTVLLVLVTIAIVLFVGFAVAASDSVDSSYVPPGSSGDSSF